MLLGCSHTVADWDFKKAERYFLWKFASKDLIEMAELFEFNSVMEP